MLPALRGSHATSVPRVIAAALVPLHALHECCAVSTQCCTCSALYALRASIRVTLYLCCLLGALYYMRSTLHAHPLHARSATYALRTLSVCCATYACAACYMHLELYAPCAMYAQSRHMSGGLCCTLPALRGSHATSLPRVIGAALQVVVSWHALHECCAVSTQCYTCPALYAPRASTRATLYLCCLLGALYYMRSTLHAHMKTLGRWMCTEGQIIQVSIGLQIAGSQRAQRSEKLGRHTGGLLVARHNRKTTPKCQEARGSCVLHISALQTEADGRVRMAREGRNT
jgi:hypothetical protein